jgi:hypothetical protein
MPEEREQLEEVDRVAAGTPGEGIYKEIESLDLTNWSQRIVQRIRRKTNRRSGPFS